jgi:hypothetical protein
MFPILWPSLFHPVFPLVMSGFGLTIRGLQSWFGQGDHALANGLTAAVPTRRCLIVFCWYAWQCVLTLTGAETDRSATLNLKDLLADGR